MTESWSSSVDAHLGWKGGGRAELANAIRAAIRDGRWRPGGVVPSTRALAHDLGVARGTVTRVYADLAAEGYLLTSQGAPTRVSTAGAEPLEAPRPARARTQLRWTFLPGRPDPGLFPRGAWLAATRRVLQHTPNDTFDYGDPRGSSVLRGTLSAYLARSRGVRVDPARIIICSGYSHALRSLSEALLGLGITEMAFEDPSIPRFRELAEAAGQRVVGVPVDEAGMRADRLASPVVVVTPAHQAPVGVTMAPGRRTELARAGAIVVEDDYDGEFRYDRQQVGALQALAPERVVYAGSVSKTLSPALRLGWLVLPRSLVDPVVASVARSGGQPPTLDQLAFADLISSGAYDRHVRRCRTEYRNRRDRLVAALPARLAPRGISAGLHLVAPLSEEAEAAAPAVARRQSLEVVTLNPQRFRPGGPGGLVIGFGAPTRPAFAGTLAALLRVIDELG